MAGKLQLPPLQALVVFEAAARLGNFTAAGHELGLSQPAVSQRIQALENVVNASLFERRHRGVQLTEAGNSLYLIVRNSLSEISEQLERTRHQRSVLRIDTDMGFASYWLLPRMERLQQLIPGVEVQIATSPNDYSFRDSNADLAIYFVTETGREPRPSGSFPRRSFRCAIRKLCSNFSRINVLKPCWHSRYSSYRRPALSAG